MEQNAELKEMLEDIRIAMFVTQAADGQSRAHPMTLQTYDAATKTLWFLCKDTSDCAQDLQRDPRFLATFSNTGKNDYVSVIGQAKLERNPEKATELWNVMNEAWFPEGPQDPSLRLIRAEMGSAEVWDGPSSVLTMGLQITRSLLGGDRPDLGEHIKMNFT